VAAGQNKKKFHHHPARRQDWWGNKSFAVISDLAEEVEDMCKLLTKTSKSIIFDSFIRLVELAA